MVSPGQMAASPACTPSPLPRASPSNWHQLSPVYGGGGVMGSGPPSTPDDPTKPLTLMEQIRRLKCSAAGGGSGGGGTGGAAAGSSSQQLTPGGGSGSGPGSMRSPDTVGTGLGFRVSTSLSTTTQVCLMTQCVFIIIFFISISS